MSTPNQFSLLTQRRFAGFFWTQFLGAGNDNIFKFAFTVLATYHASTWGGLDPQLAGAVIGGVFILPFVFFSAIAGQLADKLEKSRLIRWVKNFEIGVALLIAAGFALEQPGFLFGGVFLMGLHSSLFGPVKYAYLPQHLAPAELTGGNGLVEMGTFVAILLGTLLGGLLVSHPDAGPHYVAATCVVFAVAGRVAAAFVPQTPSRAPELRIDWNPLSSSLENLRRARVNRTVFLSLMGISWLWFFGAVFLTSFSGYARATLSGNESVVALLLALFSIGIGLGSLLCERLSGRRVEIGLVPFGSIGMTVFAVDLYFASTGLAPAQLMNAGTFVQMSAHWRVMADLFLLAMFAGFYSVPLYALVQLRSKAAERARIIAANNILNALFMVVASLMTATLIAAGYSLPQVFLITGLLNALVAAYIYRLVPEFLMRFIVWLLVHTMYRLRTLGIEHIPQKGPCVLISNHVSFVDPLVIGAACPRPPRFVMDHRIFSVPVLNFVFRESRAIPIASAKVDAALLEHAYEEIAAALAAGEVVCIFPEGRITDTGEMNVFKRGIRRVLDKSPVPVVPLALRGLWGSFFSRKGGAAMTRPFRRGLFTRIEVVAGAPLAPEDVTPERLQEIVLALRGDWR